jgi:hypothetical protein
VSAAPCWTRYFKLEATSLHAGQKMVMAVIVATKTPDIS